MRLVQRYIRIEYYWVGQKNLATLKARTMKLSERMQEWANARWIPPVDKVEDAHVMSQQSVLLFAIEAARLEARIKALEASASKSVLRRLDAQLKESDT